MGHHVVQLARDPGPFTRDGGAGVLVPGQLQLASQFGQLADVLAAVAQAEPGQRGPADQELFTDATPGGRRD